MKTKLLLSVVVALLLGGAGGYWFATQNVPQETAPQSSGQSGEKKVLFYRNPMNPAITSPVPAKDEMGMDYIPVYEEDEKSGSKEKKILFYRNPMNPAITSPVPAKDEMGMDYIPVYADDEGGKERAGTVSIDATVVQNIGVRTASVEKRDIARRINALGRVAYDEEHLARLHPKTSGWIKTLRIDRTGERVTKNTILLSIYSPDLVAAQREYLVALQNWENLPGNAAPRVQSTTKTVLDSALERLELLDVPAHQIRELRKKRKISKYLHIHSPFEGTVMHIGAREGQYVTPKDELYMIADLQMVWVYVDVYEDDIPWVKLGDAVEMKVRAVPGKVFRGKIGFIYPYLEGKTRTIRVRLEFENKDNALKPGMFANVVLQADPRPGAVVVPSSAIVRSGNTEQVFVVRGPGKFEPREVVLGLSADGYTQIIEGVEPGEEVVTSATFLIDSESKLKEATAKMLEAMQQQGKPGMDMEGMSMDEVSMDDMSMDDMSLSDDVSKDMDMTDMQMSQ